MLGFLPVSGNEASRRQLDALIMRGVLKLYVDDLSGAIADLGSRCARCAPGCLRLIPDSAWLI